jgi:Bacterial regulatory proteins, luxR family
MPYYRKHKTGARALKARTNLTTRERGVLRLLALGWTVNEIGFRMHKSCATIGAIKQRLCWKFNCSSKQLGFMGFVLGVVDREAVAVLGYVRAIAGPPVFIFPEGCDTFGKEDEPPTPTPLQEDAAKRTRHFERRLEAEEAEVARGGLRIPPETREKGSRKNPFRQIKNPKGVKAKKVAGEPSDGSGEAGNVEGGYTLSGDA